jgi:serine protease Do
MSLLTELADTTRHVAARVSPSVVRIGRHGGRGCGVVVDTGLVLTNAHNLRGAETTITFADGRAAVGTVAAVDVDGDLAAIEVDTDDVPVLEWSTTPVQLGDSVFAVSLGAANNRRVSHGSVSATERTFRGPRGRRITGSLEHTAPLTRGSSGSPLADADGALIGLNTNRLGDGFYLALPADAELQQRLDTLRAGRAPRRPRLGVGLAPPEVARRLRRSVGLPERDGLLVRAVEADGPADRGGLKQGDLIVSADGRPVADADQLYEVLDGASETLRLGVVRGADDLELEITFTPDPT